MKKILLLTILYTLYLVCDAQEKKIWDETELEKKERLSWWTKARFGMFIHWGLYALEAEKAWFKTHNRLTNEEYQKYVDIFDPDLYDPKDWARQAKAAGMKYAVITTKHHDGFVLFDSKYTEHKATNTPYGKDLIKEWVDAFRAEGLKIGFYYSLLDWHHPHYTVDLFHPLRPLSSPEINHEFWKGGDKTTSPETDKEYDELNQGRDISKYRKYLKNQVTELLTNYGEVSMLWLDFTYERHKHGKTKEDWGSVELLKHIRKLQPGIIINDRAGVHDYAGGWDYRSPEQAKLREWPTENGQKVYWETCQTFSGAWTYSRDQTTWKSNKQLITMLISTVSNGGNLLLNVGPTARGTFDYRAENRLSQIGDWMKFNDRSIYGCTQVPENFAAPANSMLTYNPSTNRLYIHLLDYPVNFLRLEGMQNKILHAQFLHDASEIDVEVPRGNWAQAKEGDLNLVLPVQKPSVEIPVIEVFLKE